MSEIFGPTRDTAIFGPQQWVVRVGNDHWTFTTENDADKAISLASTLASERLREVGSKIQELLP